MLTRKSRKEIATSPSDEIKSSKSKTENVGSPKDRSLKSKKSTTPRRKSKSAEKSIRTRSRSSGKTLNNPTVSLERLSIDKKTPEKLKKDPKSKKLVESVELKKSKQSPSSLTKDIANKSNSNLVDKINDEKAFTRSMMSRLTNNESDNEVELLNNRKIVTSSVEFGGLFGNFILAISLPILVILSKIAVKTKGILIPFPRGYLRYSNYYDRDVFIWSIALLTIQLLISLFPLAKKTEGLLKYDSKPTFYRFSGFVNLIISVVIVAALEYYKLPIKFILDIVTKKTVPHIVASVLFALIISVVLYITAKLKNQINKSSSLNIFQNFFLGATVNPTLGPVNIKLALYRYSFLLTILFNYLVIADSLKSSVNINLCVVAGLQILYALDKLMFEFTLLPSFYLQKEKFGYWTIIQQFLLPVINFLPIQILLTNNLSVNYIILSIASILFLFGFILQRYSDFIKYRYETNIHTKSYGGKRRITQYIPWSYVKYPSYIGTIIVHFALILPTIEPTIDSLRVSWPVLLYVLYYVVTLSHRCVRVSTERLSQYGGHDDYFASKWNLIPKIF